MTPEARPTLAVIPTFLREEKDLDLVLSCLVSLRATAPDVTILVVDDASPERRLVDLLGVAVEEVEGDLFPKDENSGFSATVNVGLKLALDCGADAVLVNADIEFTEVGWLDRMRARVGTDGMPAAVVGARLLFPNGLLQHAGVNFSLLNRDWVHRYKLGPADLPEALSPCRCPVTAALQLIRYETLVTVGLYDEGFRMGFEDVDYCLRTFAEGLECIYDPSVCAIHHESMFRSRKTQRVKDWEKASQVRLWSKWASEDLTRWVPEAL